MVIHEKQMETVTVTHWSSRETISKMGWTNIREDLEESSLTPTMFLKNQVPERDRNGHVCSDFCSKYSAEYRPTHVHAELP